MATRLAKLQFDSMTEFLARWDSDLSQGSVFLPAGIAPADLAAEFRLDLNLPLGVHLGPFSCQVVHKGADGSIGARIPEISNALQADIDAFFGLLDQIRDWYVEHGEVVRSEDVPDVDALRAELEAQAANIQQIQDATPGTPPPAQRSKQRGLLLPNVAGRSPDAEGELAGRQLRDLLMGLAIEKSTGLLTIVTAEGTKRWGFWLKGGPVGWRAEPIQAEETLGVLLLKAEHITKEQLAQSLQLMESENIRQGEALIEMGLLNFGQMISVLEKQVEFILQNVLHEAEGLWAFHRLDGFQEQFVNPPVRVPSLLYRALRDHSRQMPREQLMERHRPNLDRYVHFNDDTGQVLAEIQFSSVEKRFLEVISANSWRLREIFTVTNLSRNQTACVLWALDELSILDYRDQEDIERYLDRISSRILSKARSILSATHFDALEIHWISLTDEIEDAHKRLLEEFDPEAYHNLTDELRKGISIIRERVEEAYHYVRDKRQRRAYREEIIETDTIINSADLLAKKGEMAIMKGDSREAVTCWSKALELIPNKTSYKDGLQRAKGVGAS